jgi:hypothetical protein
MTLSQAVRELAIAGIRSAHPGASEREVDIRLAARLYGRDVARRIYGVTPDDL